jgi:hypothetical protein
VGHDDVEVVPYEEKVHDTGEGGATQYTFPDIDEPVWIPNSQIVEDDEDRSEVTVPTWFAIDKGLV